MAEYPMTFTAHNALLAMQGKKTQTRRVIAGARHLAIDYWEIVERRGKWFVVPYDDGPIAEYRSRYGGPSGDTWWCREPIERHAKGYIIYSADGLPVVDSENERIPWHWKPTKLAARYMPKWACRTHCDVTGLGVERVQDISIEDAIAEGVGDCVQPRLAFAQLWDSINGKTHPWADNDWVMAYTFRRLDD